MKTLVKQITDFLWDNCNYLYNENKIEDLLKEVENDLKFNHIIYISDDKGLIGVCRFKIEEEITRILDIAVRKDRRNTGVLQELLKQGLLLYPDVKVMTFNSIKSEREFKIPVSFLLKEPINGNN